MGKTRCYDKKLVEVIKERKRIGIKTAQATVKDTRLKNDENAGIICIGTWNVRGTYFERAIKNLVKEAQAYKIFILAIQETKQLGTEIMQITRFFRVEEITEC